MAFRYPDLLTGRADVREWYDERAGCFRINVDVWNHRFGPLFGYRGRFQAEWVPVVPGAVPVRILPVRQEARD